MRKLLISVLRAVFIVAIVAPISCSQNTTESVNIAGGHNQIVIGLPATRTYLGNKAKENYPVYWSEGDVIVADGIASTSIEINDDKRYAVFGFANHQIDIPCNLTYPYTEGSLCTKDRPTVVFNGEQHYVERTFGVGDVPMCGYRDNPEHTTLKYLAGVMRLAIKGSTTLSKIEIKAEESVALAGEFDVDCQTGAISAIEGRTTNKITYTVERPLSQTENQIFHIVVPAGNLGKCRVSLIDSDGLTMELRWNATDVKPGIVREFKPFAFTVDGLSELEGLESENGDLVIETPDGPVVIQKYEDPDSLALMSAKRTELNISNANGYVISTEIFDVAQTISVVTLSPSDYALKLVLPAELAKVSETATSLAADYAINGSYWNVSTGVASTMIKIDGEVLSSTNAGLNPRVNGLLFIYDNGIEFMESYAYPNFEGVIESCDNVLSCGPLLMDNGVKISYEDFLSQTNASSSVMSMITFFETRHPRTVIGKDKKGAIYFMVVDGRSAGNAEGMSIVELAKVCEWLGMTEAMNLDGGGSSTLWSFESGIINYPCDNKMFDHEGERSVLSCIVAIRKQS